MGQTRVVRLAQVLALLVALLVVGQGHASADTPPAGAPVGAALPRASATVDVKVGTQSIAVHPLRTVKAANGREAVAGRIIVRYKDGVGDADKADVSNTASGKGVTAARAVADVTTKAQLVDVSGAPSLDAAVQAYRADPRVQYAEPDYILHTTLTPNDPDFSQQYGLGKIQAPAAWDIITGSPTVKIAILDCGIYEAGSASVGPGHPDLNGKIVARQDFTASTHGTDDLCNHGTHVAGIAGASTNNGIGVAGVGYNVSLMNGKVLDDTGSGTDSMIAQGIQWATNNGAQVINLSLGGDGACSSTEQDAVTYAWTHNVVVVAAAGNNASTAPFAPASCDHVVSVASTDSGDAKSNFSNYGASVKVAAPGTHILSSVNPNLAANAGFLYASFSGTSMATPHVAGLAGLLWSTGRYTTAQAVVDRIEGTADAVPGTGTFWRYGRINAAAAVAAMPLLQAIPTTLPFGSVTTTITWNTAAGPGQVWASNNGGPESLFAQGAAGSQDASFIVSGSYTFKLYAGTTHTTLLAPAVAVNELNPKGTTGAAILAQPASFAFQPGVILNTTTVQFDTGNDAVGDVYVRLNGGPDVLFTENVINGQTAKWIQSGTYTFTLKRKADGITLDTATVTTGAGLAASPANLSGGGAPGGAATQVTYNSGSGTPAVACVAGADGQSVPISYSNSGAGIETLHLGTGSYTVTLYIAANGQPIASVAAAAGQCTANVPLTTAPGVQPVTVAVSA